MANADFSDAALVLLAHGSTQNDESAAPAYRHAAALRQRGLFAQVAEAFWKQEPQVIGVLKTLGAARVFVVPLFLSEGYFSDEVIPSELGFPAADPPYFPRLQKRGRQTLFYCGPIGTHSRVTEVVLARALEVAEKHPFPRAPKPKETALFIAGHGTARNENSRRAIERQAGLIGAQEIFAEVHAVFLEEEPRINRCCGMAQVRNLIVVPFFLSDGLHSSADIPILLGEPEAVVRERLSAGQPAWRNPTERNGKLVWYSASVGTDPRITEIILERVREAEALPMEVP